MRAGGWCSLGAVFHLPCCLPLPILGVGSGNGWGLEWGGTSSRSWEIEQKGGLVGLEGKEVGISWRGV